MERFVPLSEVWGDVRVGPAAARRVLRCDEARLDRLCELGLPYRGEGDERTFGECDLMNVGLAAGGGRSVPELARRRALAFAAGEPGDWVSERAWQLVVAASCNCGGRGPGAWSTPRARPELYGGGVDSLSQSERGASIEMRFELRTRGREASSLEPAVGEEMDALLALFDAGSLRFHYLPKALRDDPVRAVAAGVVDCVALTLHLAQRLRDRGLRVTTRCGHLLAAIGIEHAWLEVGSPPHAVPVDPMLAVLARETTAANPLFHDFCVGSISNRVLVWGGEAGAQIFSHACEAPATAPPRVTVSARRA